MSTAKFDYLFADDPHTTMPELRERTGQYVAVGRELLGDERDREAGRMFEIAFADGHKSHAFEDELSEWGIPEDPEPMTDEEN